MVKFANPRTRHPFHMHDMILGQPGFVQETLDRLHDLNGKEFLSRTRNLVVTGCGTSFHAALIGAQLLQQALGDESIVHAVQAYDLMHGHVLPKDCVVLGVSHSGSTPTTNQALALARRSGAVTRGLCGLDATPMADVVEKSLVIGSVHDHSWANTMSYTTQLTTFARLAETISRTPDELFPDGLASLPGIIEKCLACEPGVRQLAKRVAAHERVTFLGSGLDEITALEAALKIRETCSFPSSGYHVEQFLHGPFLSLNRRDAVIALRSRDDGERETQILRGVGKTGASVTIVGEAARANVRLPAMDRFLRPLISVIPLQFVAYYVALERKANPDVMRSEIPRYRKGLEPMFA